MSARTKYASYELLAPRHRDWPNRRLDRPPVWASVDLRDGNQSLRKPMSMDQRIRFFLDLVAMGFREIEVGFPLASETDRMFIRTLAERGLVPNNVIPQVMAPAKTEHLRAAVDAVAGLPRAIIQLYNPTSPAQRRTVFRSDRHAILRLAVDAARELAELRTLTDTQLMLQYAPESFTQTEPDFALEVCNAVLEVWQPTRADGTRINLPATVECFPPNEFADRVEMFDRGLLRRGEITLSVHPHNDRGTAVAAAELAVLAGADRVEGTVGGQGERTGNVCLVTLAMNLFSQGIDPGLDLSYVRRAPDIVAEYYGAQISPKHPWIGEDAFTSMAGSHQDAIAKGLLERAVDDEQIWDVPYLLIDPGDIGRNYSSIVRFTAQSGKGGVGFLLRSSYSLEPPAELLADFSGFLKDECDRYLGEADAETALKLFESRYCTAPLFGSGESDDGPGEEERDHDTSKLAQDFTIHTQSIGPNFWIAYLQNNDLDDKWKVGSGSSLHKSIRRALHKLADVPKGTPVREGSEHAHAQGAH